MKVQGFQRTSKIVPGNFKRFQMDPGDFRIFLGLYQVLDVFQEGFRELQWTLEKF